MNIPPNIQIGIFRETVVILEECGLSFRAEAGTLLRIIRKENYLTTGQDLDFSAWASDITLKMRKRLINHFLDQGYQVRFKDSKMTCLKNGMKIDLWFLQRTGNKAHRQSIRPTTRLGAILAKAAAGYSLRPSVMAGWLHARLSNILRRLPHVTQVSVEIPLNLIASTRTESFMGVDVLVPKEAERYLALRYGETWRIPNPEWDKSNDGVWSCNQT